jgi:hypothetical protein
MKSNTCLPVEFLAGTSVEDAIKEAKQKAVLLCVAYITFNFNGVRFSISSRADVEKCAKEFLEALSSDLKTVVM